MRTCYLLGVDSVKAALSALGQLSFVHIKDQAVSTPTHIEVHLWQAPRGVIVAIVGGFTGGERGEVKALGKYVVEDVWEDRAEVAKLVRQALGEDSDEIAFLCQEDGASAISSQPQAAPAPAPGASVVAPPTRPKSAVSLVKLLGIIGLGLLVIVGGGLGALALSNRNQPTTTGQTAVLEPTDTPLPPTPTSTPTPPPGPITEFTLPNNGSSPLEITTGLDGNLWFTEGTSVIGDFSGGSGIGRITPSGQITEFPLPTIDGQPFGITAGPDGNLWFTEVAPPPPTGGPDIGKIGRVTPSGTITEFLLPTSSGLPLGITAGPDGNLWFTELATSSSNLASTSRIGRITPDGTITEFPFPGGTITGITAGPDGNLWFTESESSEIGRITPSGKITRFSLPTSGNQAFGITAGPDGNLWFAEFYGSEVGRITPGGQITEFPLSSNTTPQRIVTGSDGALWFTESGGNKIGRLTTGGEITEFPLFYTQSLPLGITAGPGGNLWFTEQGDNKIGRLTPGG